MRQVMDGGSAVALRAWVRVGRVLTVMALAMALAVPVALLGAPGVRAGAAVSPRLQQVGYRLLGGDGGIFAFGAPFFGAG